MPFETEISPDIAQLGRQDPVTVGPITTAGNTTILPLPMGLSRRIFRIYLRNNGSVKVIVRLRQGGPPVFIVQAPLAANGGGVILGFGDGWKLSGNNPELIVNLPAGGPFSVFVNVLEHAVN